MRCKIQSNESWQTRIIYFLSLCVFLKMKTIVAVVVIAICAVQTTSGYGILDTLQDGIDRQKTTVDNTLDRLKRQDRDFFSSLNTKLYNVRINSGQEIISITDSTRKIIQEATKKSTSEGKDATNCFESASSKLQQNSNNGFNGIDKCQSNGKNSMSSIENNIDSAIRNGETAMSYLDRIFPSCYSSNTQQTANCIVGMLPQATQMIKSFENTADNVIRSSNLAANTIEINSINCSQGSVKIVRQGATNVQIEANKCIAAL